MATTGLDHDARAKQDQWMIIRNGNSVSMLITRQ
jgi:hypothetical protein